MGNPNVDIFEAFLDKQYKKNTIALIGILLFFVVYVVINVILNKEIKSFIPIFLAVMSVVITLNQSFTAYRVKKQYFGTCYDEAKEILYFVKESKDKNPTNGKFIFTEEQQKMPVVDKQTEYSWWKGI